MRRILPLVLALAFASAPALAADATHKPVTDCAEAKALPAGANAESRRLACEIPDEYRQDVFHAENFGPEMRRHDLAAWLTTDALAAIGAFDHLEGPGRGWLTHDHGDHVTVRYFHERDFETTAFAEADLDLKSGKAVRARKLSPEQPPTADERAMLHARELAMGRMGPRCSGKLNSIIFPFTDENGRRTWRVYLMSAWEGGPFVFGGHTLVTVTGDGSAVLGATDHTRACLPFDDPAEHSGEGRLPVAMVSHLTSPTPNEFHVFLSLQHHLPIYVGTSQNKLLWLVDGPRISLVDAHEPEADKGVAPAAAPPAAAAPTPQPTQP